MVIRPLVNRLQLFHVTINRWSNFFTLARNIKTLDIIFLISHDNSSAITKKNLSREKQRLEKKNYHTLHHLIQI